MIKNQRKMMMMATRRNSQSQRREQQPKAKAFQSKAEIFQRTWKYHSTALKTRKMKDMEKLMFSEEDAVLGFEVASNHLILKNMMAQMSFSTLKAARLVSKEWKKLASLELERRKCARMVLKSNNQFQPQLKILRNSDDVFSWMEFDLKFLNVEELSTFANLFGHQVKMLKLSPWAVHWNILSFGWFHKLEILRFHKCGTEPAATSNNPWLLMWTFIADKLLPDLKRIEGILISDDSRFPSRFLERKGHLVKSVKLDSWDWDVGSTALDHITALAQTQPKLERLVIEEIKGDWSIEFAEQTNLMFDSSRESLRTLEMTFSITSPFYFRPQLELSQIYTSLSTFRLCTNFTCFHLKNQLQNLNQEGLPKLKTVQIEVNSGVKLDFSDPLGFLCFPFEDIVIRHAGTSASVLTSVVNLEVNCRCMWDSPQDLLPWLSTLYPNVQNLTIKDLQENDEVFRHFFTLWPNLTSLSLSVVNIGSSSVKLDLDPVFTGLAAEKCQELRKQPEKMRKELLEERTWPNLNSLKELKRLDLIVTGSISRRFWCPLSLTSFLYAINLRPELKTTIRFPEKALGYRKFLEPLATYARLEGFPGTDWKF